MGRIKRAVIDFSDGQSKIRVSKPGIDVDLAGDTDLLLHEDWAMAQVYHTTFVPCPFAGYTGNQSREAIVDVAIPPVSDNPLIRIYGTRTARQEETVIFPVVAQYTSTVGTSPNLDVGIYFVGYNLVSASLVQVHFFKHSYARHSPDGAYLYLQRGGRGE